jgi:HEAT repeat protein
MSAAVAVAAALGGCGSTPSDAPIDPAFDLHHPSATRRVKAASVVGATRDARFVPDLILLLDDEDEGVRLAAGNALRETTGRDTGYRASDSPTERAAAVVAWRAWWASQAGTPPPSLPPGEPRAP